MRSIRYAGNDFSELCSAEVVRRAPLPVVTDAMTVPGRAGALLVSGRVPASDVTVRLFLDMGFKGSENALADARHKLIFWLCLPGGGELVLPDEPERVYRDAVMVDAGDWSSLFSDGKCDVTFRLYDPVAYGLRRVERTPSFEVGGTWPTWPEYALVASAGDGLSVSCPALGSVIALDYTFAGGEAVIIDCQTEDVRINDADARDVVTLSSDFFALEPGDCTLAFSGCSYAETHFFERWL